MFGVMKTLRAGEKLFAEAGRPAISKAWHGAGSAKESTYRRLGNIGRGDKDLSEAVVRSRGRRRAMGLGAGAIVLNSQRTGESTGGTGSVSPRTPGGFA